ncbi:cell division protein FtsQ/DivIB [Candidatus Profftia tarda]|uniref:Cell division protein FtsQ n=1 Tax=Candidatus Profftia tarda TaxID=1177216 RepID=A0A8E4GI70_9ENTR|nr:cell division protein FtsQ/DivIB [Candidatus Profftia tarda]CAD6508624.1 Cell division protein FtsQ [Candidatus Profftia tarda]
MHQAAINNRELDSKSADFHGSNNLSFFGIFFLLTVLGLIAFSTWMLIIQIQESSCMLLSTIVITGERHFTNDDDIREKILLSGPLSSFMKQNVAVIQQQIKNLPWIKKVSVRKQWPNILKIHLAEYTPIARWNDLCLIDSAGKIFNLPLERTVFQKIPLLYGPEGTENHVLEGYHFMSQELIKNKIKVKMVSMNTRQSWKLCLEDDMYLELGRDDLFERLIRFEKIYPVLQKKAHETDQRISYIDLRYDNGGAVGMASSVN